MPEQIVQVRLKVPDGTVFCEIDYPGFVYRDGPRLSFLGADGRYILCRSPTEAELVLLQSAMNARSEAGVQAPAWLNPDP